jgi:hypothetical protein
VVVWKGHITHVNSFDLNAISSLPFVDMGCLPSAILLLVHQKNLLIHPRECESFSHLRHAEGTLHQSLTL